MADVVTNNKKAGESEKFLSQPHAMGGCLRLDPPGLLQIQRYSSGLLQTTASGDQKKVKPRDSCGYIFPPATLTFKSVFYVKIDYMTR